MDSADPGAAAPPSSRAPLRVRQATLADLSTVVELRLSLLRENAKHPVYGRLRRDAEERAIELFARQLESGAEAIFLAERGDEIIGILRCVESIGSPLLEPARYCYVSSVYVRPAARRTGVLRQLMRRAVAWCRDRGLGEMRLHNVASSLEAGAAWDSFGFEVVEHVRVLKLAPTPTAPPRDGSPSRRPRARRGGH